MIGWIVVTETMMDSWKLAYPTDPYHFSELKVDEFLYSQPDDEFKF